MFINLITFVKLHKISVLIGSVFGIGCCKAQISANQIIGKISYQCITSSVVLVRACNFSFSFSFSNLAQ